MTKILKGCSQYGHRILLHGSLELDFVWAQSSTPILFTIIHGNTVYQTPHLGKGLFTLAKMFGTKIWCKFCVEFFCSDKCK